MDVGAENPLGCSLLAWRTNKFVMCVSQDFWSLSKLWRIEWVNEQIERKWKISDEQWKNEPGNGRRTLSVLTDVWITNNNKKKDWQKDEPSRTMYRRPCNAQHWNRRHKLPISHIWLLECTMCHVRKLVWWQRVRQRPNTRLNESFVCNRAPAFNAERNDMEPTPCNSEEGAKIGLGLHLDVFRLTYHGFISHSQLCLSTKKETIHGKRIGAEMRRWKTERTYKITMENGNF